MTDGAENIRGTGQKGGPGTESKRGLAEDVA